MVMDRTMDAIGARKRVLSTAVGCAAGLILCAPAGAEIVWSVTFANAQNVGAWVPTMSSAVLAAGAEWSQYIKGDARLDIQVVIDPTISRSTGRSVTSDYLFH